MLCVFQSEMNKWKRDDNRSNSIIINCGTRYIVKDGTKLGFTVYTLSQLLLVHISLTFSEYIQIFDSTVKKYFSYVFVNICSFFLVIVLLTTK